MNLHMIKYTFVLIIVFSVSNIAQNKRAIVAPNPPTVLNGDSLKIVVPNLNSNFNFENFFQIDKETEKELMKNMKEGLKQAMKVLKSVNKEKYYEFLRESQFKNIKIPFFTKKDKIVHERDQRIFELEVKTEALAAKYDKATEVEKKRIRMELKEKLSELFEEKEKRRKNEVEELQNELSELKKSLEIRKKNKMKIIERKLQELLNEDDYLDWE